MSPNPGSRTQTHRLLDAAVVVRVQDAIRAVRAVAGDEHAAEAVVLEAVAAARGLVAADGAALALRVPVELDTLAVGDAAAVLAVGQDEGEHGSEDEGSDGELHICRGSGSLLGRRLLCGWRRWNRWVT